MGKMDEQIIVIKRSDLFTDEAAVPAFQGTEHAKTVIDRLIGRMAACCTVMRRGDAEENEAYKQPITYAVLKQGDRYFTYRRLGGGGEERLYGKLSIGVGGHMNEVRDAADFHQVLARNLDREINEELVLEHAEGAKIRTVGLINDDQSEVGKVHIGILNTLELPAAAEVAVREKDKLAGSWHTLDELRHPDRYKRMESWSAFAIDALAAI